VKGCPLLLGQLFLAKDPVFATKIRVKIFYFLSLTSMGNVRLGMHGYSESAGGKSHRQGHVSATI
jgi:hypothetical protein